MEICDWGRAFAEINRSGVFRGAKLERANLRGVDMLGRRTYERKTKREREHEDDHLQRPDSWEQLFIRSLREWRSTVDGKPRFRPLT